MKASITLSIVDIKRLNEIWGHDDLDYFIHKYEMCLVKDTQWSKKTMMNLIMVLANLIRYRRT
jgi:hypothetical protein